MPPGFLERPGQEEDADLAIRAGPDERVPGHDAMRSIQKPVPRDVLHPREASLLRLRVVEEQDGLEPPSPLPAW